MSIYFYSFVRYFIPNLIICNKVRFSNIVCKIFLLVLPFKYERKYKISSIKKHLFIFI